MFLIRVVVSVTGGSTDGASKGILGVCRTAHTSYLLVLVSTHNPSQARPDAIIV